jgi:hypothetical protein
MKIYALKKLNKDLKQNIGKIESGDKIAISYDMQGIGSCVDNSE